MKYTRKNITLKRWVSLLVIAAFLVGNCLIAEKGHSLAVNYLSSHICSVRKLPNGTFEIYYPTEDEIENANTFDETRARYDSFTFLGFLAAKSIVLNDPEDLVVATLKQITAIEPFKSYLADYFDIGNLKKKNAALVVPFKKNPSRGVMFTVKQTLPSDAEEEGLKKANGETINFAIVDLTKDGAQAKVDRSVTTDDLNDILLGKYIGSDFDEKYDEYKAERNDFVKTALEDLIQKGGRVSYFYEISPENGGKPEWVHESHVKKKQGDTRLRVPVIEYDNGRAYTQQAFLEGLLGKLEANVNGNCRAVYINGNVVIKTMHYHAHYGPDVQVKVLLDEYRVQHSKSGGVPFARPVGILRVNGEDFWFIEELGYKFSAAELIKKGDIDKARDITKKKAMLLRFFYDIGEIPDQFDEVFDKDGDRIFLTDAAPHQYGGRIDKKDIFKSLIRNDIRRNLEKEDGYDEEQIKELCAEADGWFDDGFNNPEQFEQYNIMRRRDRIEVEKEAKAYALKARADISKVWGTSFRKKVWGTIDYLVDNVFTPIGTFLVRLKREVRGIGTLSTPRTVILYADALEQTVAFDLASAMKSIQKVLRTYGGGGNVIIYANSADSEAKAKALKKMIDDATEEIIDDSTKKMNIRIVRREDLGVEEKGAPRNTTKEAGALISYLTRKDEDRDGLTDIREKDIVGIMLSSDNLHLREEVKDYEHEVPCIIMNTRATGVFSLSQAFEEMINAFKNGKYAERKYAWVKMLNPIKPLTGEMYKDYESYRKQVLFMA